MLTMKNVNFNIKCIFFGIHILLHLSPCVCVSALPSADSSLWQQHVPLVILSGPYGR